MPIAEADLNGIAADGLHGSGANAGFQGLALHRPLARVLVYAAGAGAVVPEFNVRNDESVTRLPGEQDLGCAMGLDSSRNAVHNYVL